MTEKTFEDFQYSTENKVASVTPRDFYDKLVPPETILQWFELCDAIWQYDYQSQKPGYHAELKSGFHSDGFLLAPEVLKHYNLRQVLARQLFLLWAKQGLSYGTEREWEKIGFSRGWEKVRPKPDFIIGIPKAAKELGRDTAGFFYANFARLEKREDGSMELIDEIPRGKSYLIVEDICTKGTGFREAVAAILRKSPEAVLVPYEFVIVNRGGLKEINVEGVGFFQIRALVKHRINEWEPGPDTCPLCQWGSMPIKPKATPENWELIKNGQK